MLIGGAAFARIDVGPKIVARYLAVRGLLNRDDALGSDRPLLFQPLPYKPLGHAKTLGERGLSHPCGFEIFGKLHPAVIALLLDFVNSMLVATRIAVLHRYDMDEKRPVVSEEVRKQEAAELLRLWEIRPHRPQQEFALAYDATQGYIHQLLYGIRPLNVRWAKTFAAELKCEIKEFSRRLAIAAAREAQGAAWPFPSIDPDRWKRLSDGKKIAIEGLVLGEITDTENAAYKSPSPDDR